MAQLLVRNLPEDTFRAFKLRAEAEGLSMEAFARQVIEREAAWATRAAGRVDALRRLDEFRAMNTSGETPPGDGPDSLELLHQLRDGDDEDC
jgi:plasmid stability protein